MIEQENQPECRSEPSSVNEAREPQEKLQSEELMLASQYSDILEHV